MGEYRAWSHPKGVLWEARPVTHAHISCPTEANEMTCINKADLDEDMHDWACSAEVSGSFGADLKRSGTDKTAEKKSSL